MIIETQLHGEKNQFLVRNGGCSSTQSTPASYAYAYCITAGEKFGQILMSRMV